MKAYWSIPGIKSAPQTHCIAFDKLDGNNMRYEWDKKKGWHKFGTRRTVIDESHEDFGGAIPLFLEKLADGLVKVFKDNYKAVKATAFCEYWGAKSFSGQHEPDDPMNLTLIDVSIHKKGIVLPQDFVDNFGHLDIAKVVYEGDFDLQLIEEAKAGKFNTKEQDCPEGIVAKGLMQDMKSKNPQHHLWMAKCKTNDWMQELRERADKDSFYKKILESNELEQQV